MGNQSRPLQYSAQCLNNGILAYRLCHEGVHPSASLRQLRAQCVQEEGRGGDQTEDIQESIGVTRAHGGRCLGKELGIPQSPLPIGWVGAALSCIPGVCQGRDQTNGRGWAHCDHGCLLYLPYALCVTTTADCHLHSRWPHRYELRQKAGCSHVVKTPCSPRPCRPHWAPQTYPAPVAVPCREPLRMSARPVPRAGSSLCKCLCKCLSVG